MTAQLLQDDPAKAMALLTYASRYSDFPQPFVPPALLDPNYVPPNSSRPLEILCWCMAAFSTVVVVLRLWVRKSVKGMSLGLDDWLIIPGQVRRSSSVLSCS